MKKRKARSSLGAEDSEVTREQALGGSSQKSHSSPESNAESKSVFSALATVKASMIPPSIFSLLTSLTSSPEASFAAGVAFALGAMTASNSVEPRKEEPLEAAEESSAARARLLSSNLTEKKKKKKTPLKKKRKIARAENSVREDDAEREEDDDEGADADKIDPSQAMPPAVHNKISDTSSLVDSNNATEHVLEEEAESTADATDAKDMANTSSDDDDSEAPAENKASSSKRRRRRRRRSAARKNKQETAETQGNSMNSTQSSVAACAPPHERAAGTNNSGSSQPRQQPQQPKQQHQQHQHQKPQQQPPSSSASKSSAAPPSGTKRLRFDDDGNAMAIADEDDDASCRLRIGEWSAPASHKRSVFAKQQKEQQRAILSQAQSTSSPSPQPSADKQQRGRDRDKPSLHSAQAHAGGRNAHRGGDAGAALSDESGAAALTPQRVAAKAGGAAGERWKRYSDAEVVQCPPLVGLPRAGDVIAFKVVELNGWVPHVSPYRRAEILAVTAVTSGEDTLGYAPAAGGFTVTVREVGGAAAAAAAEPVLPRFRHPSTGEWVTVDSSPLEGDEMGDVDEAGKGGGGGEVAEVVDVQLEAMLEPRLLWRAQ